MILDGIRRVNLTAYDRTVTLERPGCGVNGRFCNFLQLPQPYSSMWLLSRERVQKLVTSTHWRCGVGVRVASGLGAASSCVGTPSVSSVRMPTLCVVCAHAGLTTLRAGLRIAAASKAFAFLLPA